MNKMECSTASHDADGMVTMLYEKIVTARKEHKCHECRGKIEKGSQYLIETYVWEGEVDRHKTCLDCLALRKSFFRDGFVYGEIIMSLQDHVNDCRGDISQAQIAALPSGARAMVCDMIEDYQSEIEEYEDNEYDR